MAAPSGTVWGSIAGSYGRIGIYTSLSSTDTKTTVSVQVWFWSKYSVSDSANTLYFDNTDSLKNPATTSQGSMSIATTVASGDGWSTSNQVLLKSFSYSYTRGPEAVVRYLSARLINVDRVGAAMSAFETFGVPALSSYTVSYNANGGSGAPSNQTKWYGTALKLSTTKPTRTGYTFQGWATSASGSVAYASGASYTGNAALTLYAVWKANTYTVSYNANGGSGAPSAQTKTYGTALTLSSTKPTRTDYTFKGWGTSAYATTVAYAAGASYTANAAITLYAIWELSYVKPRITNLSVSRCDANGTKTDSGTYAFVYFGFACDKTISSAVITMETSTGTVALSKSLNANNPTNGSVSEVVGGALSADTTYSYTVTVKDAGGYTTMLGTLPGSVYPIDFLPGGKGVGIGKAAEIRNLMDVGLRTRSLGGYLYPVLEPETNLNDVRTPNTYTGANVTNYNYANCPMSSGTFTLIVESCGEDGQVRQTYINCSKYKPQRFVRFYYQGSWGDWMFATTEEMVLFENASGAAGTITLKYSAEHYAYLEIYFTDNNNKGGGYTKIRNPHNSVAHLQLQEAGATIYLRQTAYAIVGTSITPTTSEASYVKITSAGAISTSIGTNYIKITKVVGLA